MALNYPINSDIYYSNTTGAVINSNSGGDTLGSPATEDGFWNPGDPSLDGSPFLYEGYYEANGHTFLVFVYDEGDTTGIVSPTAEVTDPGYPATLGDLPALDTSPLAVCFLAGSLIATPEGEVAVETLNIGDTVLTASGTPVPVRWMGRQTVRPALFGPGSQPVRIRAGALGDGQPHTDLSVTPDHGMVIDGHVVTAGALVNGDGIDRVPLADLPDRFTVYHVETEAHDVILANGAPSETFVDAAGRAAFDNHDEYLALYGVERIVPEMPLPRITSARLLPARLRARLSMGRAVPGALVA